MSNETTAPDVDKERVHARVIALASALPERDRTVLFLSCGLEDWCTESYSCRDIARIFKVTKERVRQIQSKSLERIKDAALPDMVTISEILDCLAVEGMRRRAGRNGSPP